MDLHVYIYVIIENYYKNYMCLIGKNVSNIAGFGANLKKHMHIYTYSILRRSSIVSIHELLLLLYS